MSKSQLRGNGSTLSNDLLPAPLLPAGMLLNFLNPKGFFTRILRIGRLICGCVTDNTELLKSSSRRIIRPFSPYLVLLMFFLMYVGTLVFPPKVEICEGYLDAPS